jgi:hypothetical protein
VLGKKRNQSQQNQPLTFYSGQIAEYLRLAKLRFVFISTYEQTIFLQQKQDTNGQRVLYYSPIIHHSFKGDSGEEVFPRQCFLHVLMKEQTKYHSNSNTLKSQWIRVHWRPGVFVNYTVLLSFVFIIVGTVHSVRVAAAPGSMHRPTLACQTYCQIMGYQDLPDNYAFLVKW